MPSIVRINRITRNRGRVGFDRRIAVSFQFFNIRLSIKENHTKRRERERIPWIGYNSLMFERKSQREGGWVGEGGGY